MENQRLVEEELIPQWKSTDAMSAGLVLDPALGNSLRTLKLIIIENPLLMIKMTWKRVLYLGKDKDLVVKLKSDNSNENPRTRFLPRG